ncbi:helix-turn-helix transcriptional regulator [Aestuariivita sp.]|jgi:transcriptional regulator with XRE-family HTH domain|uniref:helix-turn-helix domain-containing protein n=1 Tax=Aestuariivita sp. TaxID=1872407 RepID=UPI00216DFABE|nr:helix-turn-helix transcriptional regulator [Aestuariivita sp.]MCE8006713.1 helix-turn-helix transcriptional regulator [Aestuariivita sp.]
MTKTTRTPAELRNMFGANLRIMARSYPSISELSRQLGINRTQFNRYLAGESFPRPDVLNRICTFFGVDARILLDPVDALSSTTDPLTGGFLNEFVGKGVSEVTEDFFPSGFYRFSRRSFVDAERFAMGFVYVFRRDGTCYVRGYEPREAMRVQGFPLGARAREYRGIVLREEEGIASLMSRRGTMTCSFNFLTRVASFDNNYWVGYVTRTVPENVSTNRVVRMVYEYVDLPFREVMSMARETGFITQDKLPPFHARLLEPSRTFR